MKRRLTACVGIVMVLSVLGAARPVLAGPPLLCHPYDIGTALSLPWQGHEWWPGRADYQVANLVAETQALLTPSTPVIVRMETLRRATIYATRDRAVAAQLLATVTERARSLERDGRPDALAWLDAAYVTEALREVSELSMMTKSTPFDAAVRAVAGLTTGADGYEMILEEPGPASRRGVDRVRRGAHRGSQLLERRASAGVCRARAESARRRRQRRVARAKHGPSLRRGWG